MNTKRRLKLAAKILGAIGLGEANHIVCMMYICAPEWFHSWNWIDVQFDFKWIDGILYHIVWQVSLINCIIIFFSMMWFSWIFFVVSDEMKTRRGYGREEDVVELVENMEVKK